MATVQSSAADVTVDAPGTVQFRREISLGFTTAGRVVRIAVNEGDRVVRGQLVAALDSATVGAALNSAQALATRNRAELVRSERLFVEGWVTRSRLEDARAALASAEANVKIARFQAVNARILAPSSGIVLARLAEPSQVVSAGQPVLQVGDANGGIVLRVPLTDRDVARLSVGASAQVALAALGGAPIAGTLVEIAGRADSATGTFDCLIDLPNDPRLRVGQIGAARIAAQTKGVATLRAPIAAVFGARAGEGFVLVVRGGRIQLRKVKLGEVGDRGIEVIAGLERGESLVVSGVDRLRDGDRVSVLIASK